MNQIILDQNWEKLMGSLYSLGKCGCVPTQAKQLGILEFIPGFLFTFLLSVFLKQFIRFQLVSRTQALQIRHTKARIP